MLKHFLCSQHCSFFPQAPKVWFVLAIVTPTTIISAAACTKSTPLSFVPCKCQQLCNTIRNEKHCKCRTLGSFASLYNAHDIAHALIMFNRRVQCKRMELLLFQVVLDPVTLEVSVVGKRTHKSHRQFSQQANHTISEAFIVHMRVSAE